MSDARDCSRSIMLECDSTLYSLNRSLRKTPRGLGARSHRARRLRASPSGGRGGRYIIIVYDTAIIIWEIRFPLQGYEGMHQKHSQRVYAHRA